MICQALVKRFFLVFFSVFSLQKSIADYTSGMISSEVYQYGPKNSLSYLDDEHFVDPEKLIVRSSSGPHENILLWGKLLGKAVIKELSRNSLDAYLLAIEHGIPTEPILMKWQRPRIITPVSPGGMYRVFMWILSWETLEKALLNASPIQKDQLQAQKKYLLDRLKNIWISYYEWSGCHAHDRNFIVVSSNLWPVVHIIDRKKAKIVTLSSQLKRRKRLIYNVFSRKRAIVKERAWQI